MASSRPSSQRSDRTSSSSSSVAKSASSSAHGKPDSYNRSVRSGPRECSDDNEDSGRVRVAVRLRPKTEKENLSETDCVEIEQELKRVKLRKNSWSSDYFKFDEVFAETASQKRVYDAVAKPVVESVLSGFNGTVMAYGQTGTGKTYTVGQLGKNDPSERGIMVRALEDILAVISPAEDTVAVSYLQLYLESVQDLLAPEKTNIPISEDPKTGEVSLPCSVIVEVTNLDQFIELLQIGEANRKASNTKLNTESSRSHAILMVRVQKFSKAKDESPISDETSKIGGLSQHHLPICVKSKLLIVDLAGSERVDKSGSEGTQLEEAKFINLSLTSLGKCIHALAENSPHIPIRDSKLTRLLRDSFGGTARTSLIVTIGPSSKHYSETSSTIAFGQRAMKVVNTMKIKEEVDYEGRCRKLESQVDYLTSQLDRQKKNMTDEKLSIELKLKDWKSSLVEAERQIYFLTSEIDRLQKLKDDEIGEMEVKLRESERLLAEAKTDFSLKSEYIENERSQLEKKGKVLNEELNFQKKRALLDLDIMKLMEELSVQKKENIRLELENKKLVQDLEKVVRLEMDLKNKKIGDSEIKNVQRHSTQIDKKKIAELIQQVEDEHLNSASLREELETTRRELNKNKESLKMLQKEMEKLNLKYLEILRANEESSVEIEALKVAKNENLSGKESLNEELKALEKRLFDEVRERKILEEDVMKLKSVAPNNYVEHESRAPSKHDSVGRNATGLGFSLTMKSNKVKDTFLSQKATISKIIDEVGLPNILALLRSDDIDVQIHAVKVVANLAAEDSNQKRIVDDGGLDALLMLLESAQDATIRSVSAGAIANLAMNGVNQGLIMSKGGARLLANISSTTDDPHTLRMIAGAIANLCGNEKLHLLLQEDGGTKALLRMAKTGNIDVIAQVARGIANFAKCESRGITQGKKKGKSVLIDDGALLWMLSNYTTFPLPVKRHIELALCHLAQNEQNSQDIIKAGGVKELERISKESSREDICSLARKALSSNPIFSIEVFN